MNHLPNRISASAMKLPLYVSRAGFLCLAWTSLLFSVLPASGATYTYTGLAASNAASTADQWGPRRLSSTPS